MDIQPIINVIKENQHLSYDEVKKQADAAGLSSEQLNEAWREAKLDPSVEHDSRIAQLCSEINALGRTSKTREQWKDYFKSKGYLDDEVDFSYATALRNKKKLKPFVRKAIISILSFLGLILSTYLIIIWAYPSREAGNYLLSALAGSVLPVLYIFFLLSGEINEFFEIMKADFGAQTENKNKFRDSGFVLLNGYDPARSGFENLFNLQYDKRDTYFGNFSYSSNEGRHSQYKFFFVVIQKLNKVFPEVACTRFAGTVYALYPPIMKGMTSLEMEGNFGKSYGAWAKDPKNAFYVLNPRVMDKLMDEEITAKLRIFNACGDFLFMAYDTFSTGKKSIFSDSYSFDEYMKDKEKLTKYLDIISDLNDILSREIVDDGKNRNISKIQS